jgi:CheY-like chemotaxis protein
MKLKQILINILGNAVKFTPEGGTVSFTIEEGRRFDNKAVIKFVMSDTGIGMSEWFMSHLYDAFSQEDMSSTNKYGSTGLGMPITKSLVELMNGHIEVQSEKGKGTTFTVTVTLGTVENAEQIDGDKLAAQAEAENAEEQAAVDLSGKRILLAEDVDVNAEIMMMLLTQKEMLVDRAENGRIALQMFEDHEPGYYDAILMDMRMPEMDGLEATRRIRTTDREDAETIPIIALTANAFDEDIQRSMQAGLNAHLSKPVEPEILYKTLGSLIK